MCADSRVDASRLLRACGTRGDGGVCRRTERCRAISNSDDRRHSHTDQSGHGDSDGHADADRNGLCDGHLSGNRDTDSDCNGDGIRTNSYADGIRANRHCYGCHRDTDRYGYADCAALANRDAYVGSDAH